MKNIFMIMIFSLISFSTYANSSQYSNDPERNRLIELLEYFMQDEQYEIKVYAKDGLQSKRPLTAQEIHYHSEMFLQPQKLKGKKGFFFVRFFRKLISKVATIENQKRLVTMTQATLSIRGCRIESIESEPLCTPEENVNISIYIPDEYLEESLASTLKDIGWKVFWKINLETTQLGS